VCVVSLVCANAHRSNALLQALFFLWPVTRIGVQSRD
jgi:hypothetical protein